MEKKISMLEILSDSRDLFGGQLRCVQFEEVPPSGKRKSTRAAFEHRDVCLDDVIDLAFDSPLAVTGRDSEQAPRERG